MENSSFLVQKLKTSAYQEHTTSHLVTAFPKYSLCTTLHLPPQKLLFVLDSSAWKFLKTESVKTKFSFFCQNELVSKWVNIAVWLSSKDWKIESRTLLNYHSKIYRLGTYVPLRSICILFLMYKHKENNRQYVYLITFFSLHVTFVGPYDEFQIGVSVFSSA